MNRGRPDWRERSYRVLFLQCDRISDMILTTGILRVIAEALPTIQLDVLASKTNALVLRNERYVHDVLVVDRHASLKSPRMLLTLRRARYDAIVDCMVTPPSLMTLMLIGASGARFRFGIAQRGIDFAYTVPVPPRKTAEHFVDKLAVLLTAFGLEPSGIDVRPRVRLTLAEQERGERVWRGDNDDRPQIGLRVLVTVSAGQAHCWPDDRFVKVIAAARARVSNAEVIVVSSPDERGHAARIAAESGVRIVGDDGLRDVLAIVSRADVVFTSDADVSHACSAFNKPVVVLAPRGFSRMWGPYETNGRAVESLTDDIEGISTEQAARALLRMLNETSSSAGRT